MKTANFTFLAHWIASLTRANFKTFLLWKVVLKKKRKENIMPQIYVMPFVSYFLSLSSFLLWKLWRNTHRHARAHTLTKAVYILYRSISFNLHCSWYVFEIEFVDGSEACTINYTVTRCTTMSTLSIQPQPLHSLFPEMYQKENRGLQEGIANPQAKLPCVGWMGWYCLMWGTKIKKI